LFSSSRMILHSNTGKSAVLLISSAIVCFTEWTGLSHEGNPYPFFSFFKGLCGILRYPFPKVSVASSDIPFQRSLWYPQISLSKGLCGILKYPFPKVSMTSSDIPFQRSLWHPQISVFQRPFLLTIRFVATLSRRQSANSTRTKRTQSLRACAGVILGFCFDEDSRHFAHLRENAPF
jgi:hypothetical protein